MAEYKEGIEEYKLMNRCLIVVVFHSGSVRSSCSTTLALFLRIFWKPAKGLLCLKYKPPKQSSIDSVHCYPLQCSSWQFTVSYTCIILYLFIIHYEYCAYWKSSRIFWKRIYCCDELWNSSFRQKNSLKFQTFYILQFIIQ